MFQIEKIYLDGGRVGAGRPVAVCDTEMPVISWAVLSDASDNGQTACQVTVSADGVTYFDSGRRLQKEQSLVCGKALPHGKVLTLTVVAEDQYGNVTPPYVCAFVNGNLTEAEMAGQWIGAAEPTNGRALYFRKHLTLTKKPAAAMLYTAGLGYHHVTVNGFDVTDAKLEPAHSNYAKTVYYSVYPDAWVHLEEGDNVLGIVVGEGWRNNSTDMTRGAIGDRKIEFAGASQLWAMLVLTYEDGTTETIATDETWGVKFGGIVDASIFNGETYDARVSDPAWNRRSGGDGFAAATVVDAPGGVMKPMALEPIRQAKEYPAIELRHTGKDVAVVDFGQNIAGVVSLRLPEAMTAGQTIVLRFAEELDEDGGLYTAPLRDAKCTDTYIASGDGRDLCFFTPMFTFHGFRYCEISGCPVTKEDVTALLWCTDLKNGSFFRCGSPLINALQQNIVMTEMDNMHSILTDCPQRDERMGWMNDATVRFEETPYNFDIGRMFPKIVRDIRAEQREEGQFTCCCPFYFGGLPADPVCSSYLMAGYQAWMHTGNVALLAESFDGFAAWEDFLLSRSDDYIVNYSYYGDWAGPYYACEGGNIDAAKNAETPGILMSTGYSYLNCCLLAKMAVALGWEDKAEKYFDLAKEIQAAFLAKWHDGHGKVDAGSQGSQSFALWLGILPEEVRQAAADILNDDLVARDFQFTTGNLCTRYMTDMLAKYGHLDTAWEFLHKDTYPSYGFMLQNEATTVWERFELKKNPGMNSHNHPMFGSVGSFFYMYLMGVTPLMPGYERIRIAPMIPEGLLSAQCVVDTVKGDVSVRYARRYGEDILTMEIPFGAVAEVTFGGETRELGSGHHVIRVAVGE